jgi:hypothetical protein
LWDDEVASQSIWNLPDDSLARSILQEAYIRVQTVTGLIPGWKQNLTDADVAGLPTSDPSTGLPASNPSTATFWTAPVSLAFEGPVNQDCDPPQEFCWFGLTNGLPLSGPEAWQPKVAIHPETIRDYAATPLDSPPAPTNRVSQNELHANTVAHEVLHLFGLIHDGNRTQGGIMCADLYVDATESNRTKVTPDQMVELRKATQMKIRRVFTPCSP